MVFELKNVQLGRTWMSRSHNDYFDRWVGLSSTPKTYEFLYELLIREQCLHNSDSKLATFVRER